MISRVRQAMAGLRVGSMPAGTQPSAPPRVPSPGPAPLPEGPAAAPGAVGGRLDLHRRLSGNLRGILAIIIATLVFCLGDTLMKLASTSLPTGELIFLRGCVGVALIAGAAFWTGAILRLRQALVAPMGYRVVGDISGAMFFQMALARMSFPDVMSILQVTPLSLTAASALFLGERVRWRRWTAVGCGLLGALLIIKPGTSAFNWWAIAAIMAVLGGTLRDVSTRRIDPAVPALVIMLLGSLAVTCAGLAMALIETWAWPSGRLMLFMAGAATCSLLGQLCTIIAVRAGEISAVAPFRYTSIVWAILLGLVIWGDLPDPVSMVGIAIIIAAGLYTFFREQKLRRLAAAERRAQRQPP